MQEFTVLFVETIYELFDTPRVPGIPWGPLNSGVKHQLQFMDRLGRATCTLSTIHLIFAPDQTRPARKEINVSLKPCQNKKGQIFIWDAPKMVSFHQLPAVKKGAHLILSQLYLRDAKSSLS